MEEKVVAYINKDDFPKARGDRIFQMRRTNSTEFLPPMMTTPQSFQLYLKDFRLDPNTVNKFLHLSEKNRRVEWGAQLSSYPDHQERFDGCSQVMCGEIKSSPCFWAVEWSGDAVNIAISYKGISRKEFGRNCEFGHNNQSWGLMLTKHSSSFWHSNKKIKLPLVTCSKIGVYVDHLKGILDFFRISDKTTYLIGIRTKFTHPLCPGFWLFGKSSVKLADMCVR